MKSNFLKPLKAHHFVLFFVLLFSFFLIKEVLYVFDPNYVEFGPLVYFNKNKDCTNTNHFYSTSPDENCYILAKRVSIYRLSPKSLSTVLEEILGKKDLQKYLSGYPGNSNGWECISSQGAIDDNSLEKTYASAIYKCWPK